MSEIVEEPLEAAAAAAESAPRTDSPAKTPSRRIKLLLSAIGALLLGSGGLAYAYYGPAYESPVHLRAGVIKGSGEVHPAARDWFIAVPYSIKIIRNNLRTLNKVGAEPIPPKQGDTKFNPKQAVAEQPEDPEQVWSSFPALYPMPSSSDERFKTNCVHFEFIDETSCYTDYSSYQDAVDSWEQSRRATYQAAKNRFAAWEKQKAQWENEKVKAYQQAYAKYLKEYHAWVEKGESNLDLALAESLAGRSLKRVQTNLDGEAEIKLKPGNWFLTGANVSSFSTLYWNEVPLELKRGARALELANDSGESGERETLDDKKEPDIHFELFSHTEKAKAMPEALQEPEFIRKALARSFKPDSQNLDGWSLLHLVAAVAPVPVRAELTHLLLIYGADINLTDKKGRTPLHLAIERGNRTSAMVLLAHGADTSKVDTEIRSPLHLAVEKGNAQLVSLLLRHKAALDAVDKKGQTPLQLAQSLKKVEIVKLLEAAGPKKS